MEQAEIVAKVKSLTAYEAKILFLKCDDLNYEEIALRMNYGIDWVQLRASEMYIKLGVPKEMHPRARKKLLKKDYCKVITELWDDQHPWTTEEKAPDPPASWLMVVKQETEFEDEERKLLNSPVEVVYLDKPKKVRKTRPWGLYVIIVALIAALIFLLTRKQVSLIPEPLPTYTPLPSYTIQPSATVEAPVIIITAKPSPTFTETPSPTITLTPTVAPLLENRFIDGISPAWTVTGNPVIIDGSITWDGNKPVTLSAGDSTWTNYEMIVSFTHFDTGSCDFYTGFRMNEGQGMLLGVVRAARLGWFKNTWNRDGWIIDNEALITDQAPTLQIIVKDNTFNWVGGTSVTLDGYPTGGVKIYLTCDKIDYIRINQLP